MENKLIKESLSLLERAYMLNHDNMGWDVDYANFLLVCSNFDLTECDHLNSVGQYMDEIKREEGHIYFKCPKCNHEFLSEINNKEQESVSSIPIIDKGEDLGVCKQCDNKPATKDYNGHKFYVCDRCFDNLNNDFDEEYK